MSDQRVSHDQLHRIGVCDCEKGEASYLAKYVERPQLLHGVFAFRPSGVEEVSPPSPLCKAQRTGVGGNDPIDCDWPFCGCDPKADRVIEAIQESGFEIIRSDAVVLKPRNEAEADWRFPPDGYRKGGAKS